MSASHYQSRPSMYFRGLIPRNWPWQFRLILALVMLNMDVSWFENSMNSVQLASWKPVDLDSHCFSPGL